MKNKLIILLMAGATGLAACAQPRLHPEMLAHSLNEPYLLSTGDRLRVIVFGQDNLSNIYTIDASGWISMPLIGQVGARGESTQGLEKQIETKLRGGFIREPKVSVEVDQYRPFFILGEVNSSGQYPFVNGMTAQTAIAIAGGFAPRAARTYVEITRQIKGQKIVTIPVPINTPLRPGDTITVKERYF